MISGASGAELAAPTTTKPPEEYVFTDADLPQIEARRYEVQTVRSSRSKTVYLLNDETSARPSPGKILLLRRDQEPVMAFRVLKVYAERRQIAARKIRVYGDTVQLPANERYEALEKIADLVPKPLAPETIADDKRELDEFEEELEQDTGEVWSDPGPVGAPGTPPPSDSGAAANPGKQGRSNAAQGATQDEKETPLDPTPPSDMLPIEYDPDLDVESSPNPNGEDELLENDENQYGVAPEDHSLIEQNRHLVSVGVGWAFNKWRSDSIFNAGGFRYSYIFGRRVMLRSSRVQDALVVEAGMLVYKPIFNEGSYTVTPFTGTIRYDIQSRTGFTFYFYMGQTINFVIPGPTSSQAKQDDLGGLLPAGGIGFLFPFGPNWNVRANLGVDSIDFGLSLRF